MGIQHASVTIQHGLARILFALEVTDGPAAAAHCGGAEIRSDREAAEFGVAEFRRDAKAIVDASSQVGRGGLSIRLCAELTHFGAERGHVADESICIG